VGSRVTLNDGRGGEPFGSSSLNRSPSPLLCETQLDAYGIERARTVSMVKAVPKKTNITVKLDTNLVRAAKLLAAQRGISLRALLVEILAELVNQDKRQG
jgi:hypothetical protein